MLLRKLRQLEFSRMALLWLKSYLQGRTQMVSTKNSGNSDWLETNLGIPQGSAVLGLLLFCLYVNDLQNVLDGRTIKHVFYADDLQIYLHTCKDDIRLGIARLADAANRCLGGRSALVCVLMPEKLKPSYSAPGTMLTQLTHCSCRALRCRVECSSRSATKLRVSV